MVGVIALSLLVSSFVVIAEVMVVAVEIAVVAFVVVVEIVVVVCRIIMVSLVSASYLFFLRLCLFLLS